MDIVPGITVNDVRIAPEMIDAEVQYHPAKTKQEAKCEAMQALVIRELLRQEAGKLDIADAANDDAVDDGADRSIEALLEQEINVDTPDDETCRRYFEHNEEQFTTSPLYEVSHILYLAPPEDRDASEKAMKKACDSLAILEKNPEMFAEIAKKDSGCSSSGEGGRLGQLGRGQTLAEFETALKNMNTGDISSKPVASDVGYHIIKLHQKEEGRPIPFDVASGWVAEYIEQQSWQTAFRQYIQILAGKAKISGFQLDAADTPLVQ